MAMVAVPVPYDVGRIFRSIDVPGERDPSDHITILNLGDDLKIDTIVRAVPLIFDITKEMEPFLVTTKKITTFPKGDNGYPIIAPVEASQLNDIHSKLKRVFDRRGIDYSKKFPDYNPHVTLGYSKKKPKNIKLPKTQWQANEVCLFGGNSHDERIYVSFPLSLNIIKKSSDYILRLTTAWKNKVEFQKERYI